MKQALNKWMAWMQELKAENCFQGANRLERAGQIVHGPGAAVTDGPFVEAEEIVGGYIISVSAASQAEATELAHGCVKPSHRIVSAVRRWDDRRGGLHAKGAMDSNREEPGVAREREFDQAITRR